MKGGPSRAGIDPLHEPMRGVAAVLAEPLIKTFAENLAEGLDRLLAAGCTSNEVSSIGGQVVAVQACVLVKAVEDRAAELGGTIPRYELVEIVLNDLRTRMLLALNVTD
jgi:hypothetical protein